MSVSFKGPGKQGCKPISRLKFAAIVSVNVPIAIILAALIGHYLTLPFFPATLMPTQFGGRPISIPDYRQVYVAMGVANFIFLLFIFPSYVSTRKRFDAIGANSNTVTVIYLVMLGLALVHLPIVLFVMMFASYLCFILIVVMGIGLSAYGLIKKEKPIN